MPPTVAELKAARTRWNSIQHRAGITVAKARPVLRPLYSRLADDPGAIHKLTDLEGDVVAALLIAAAATDHLGEIEQMMVENERHG